MRGKRLVIPGIVEIGEHEVLPDQQAELVAELEEIRRLVGHGAADADHVHAGLGGQPQERLVIRPRAGQSDDIGRGPHRATAEHPLAIDQKREIVAIGAAISLDGAEAGAPDRMLDAVDDHGIVVEIRRAMRVRPPGLDVLNLQNGGIVLLADLLERLFDAAAAKRQLRRIGVGMQRYAEPARAIGLEHRADRDIVERHDIATHQRDRPPGTDGMDLGAPAGHMAEQRGADILQPLRRDHLRPPAGARAGFGNARASARKHSASSSPPDSVTGISCSVNMLSEKRISWPFRNTWQSVARPSKRRIASPGSASNSRQTYQASLPSSGSGSHDRTGRPFPARRQPFPAPRRQSSAQIAAGHADWRRRQAPSAPGSIPR
jgi:hypothetical protein